MTETGSGAAVSTLDKQYCVQKRVEMRKFDEAMHHLRREETVFLTSHDYRVRQVQRRMEILRDKRNKIVQERMVGVERNVFTLNNLAELSRAAHAGQRRHRRTSDALVQTDMELKKVSWRTPPPTPYSSSDEDSDSEDTENPTNTRWMGITRTNRSAGHYSGVSGFRALPFMGLARTEGFTTPDKQSKSCLQHGRTPGDPRNRGQATRSSTSRNKHAFLPGIASAFQEEYKLPFTFQGAGEWQCQGKVF
ncbi:Hypp1360 [Branchiostoma lanceolatum]|uniref:Hypp1360 protein n=1 Tax=Branchiostoma lanceolatum TaxID=7740 RepID=A0A8K0EK95_BRALA|nr:Hypp1360 [Branchiostoma lanceolatum]